MSCVALRGPGTSAQACEELSDVFLPLEAALCVTGICTGSATLVRMARMRSSAPSNFDLPEC